MIKIFFVIILSVISLYSQNIKFKETKFVEALELYTYRDGTVNYSQKRTVVSYMDGKTISKQDSNLTVHNSDNELLTTIDLNKKPDIALYFKLTKALFLKDFSGLEDSFEIKEPSKGVYDFIPKDDMKNVIKKIELYLNNNDSIDNFTIQFENGDSVKIEAK